MSAPDKKKAIVEAATRLFLAQGFGHTSMEAIAADAGVAKQTLYSHFSGKEDLFHTIIRQRCASIFEGLPESGAEDIDPREYMIKLGRRLMDKLFMSETLELYRLVVAETPRFPELGRAYYDAGPGAAVAIFAAFLKRNGLDGGEGTARARQFFGMLAGHFLTEALLNPGYCPPQSERDAFIGAAAAVFACPRG